MSIRPDALPEMVQAWNALARDAAANLKIQIDVADFGGFRTPADTALILQYRLQDYALYAAAQKKAGKVPVAIEVWRKIAPHGSSYHDYGAARDATIKSRPASMTYDQAVTALRGIAGRNGLAVITNDPLHFQLPITLSEAQRRWAAYKKPAAPAAPPAIVPLRPVPTQQLQPQLPAPYDDTTSSDDDAAGGDSGELTSDDSSARPGGALLGALLALVTLGGAYLFYRRMTS